MKTKANQTFNDKNILEDRTTFFYYMFRNILLFDVPLLITSGLVLSHLSLHSSATISDSESDNVTLTLSTSCTMSSSIIDAHTASLNGGQYESEIGNTKISTYCNDNNGYSIYAIGSGNNVDGNTDLVSSINDNYNIHTGIYDSSSTSSYTPSSWSMKLTPGLGTGINPDTGESITVTPPTIRNNYDSYSLVPENYTLVASRPSRTDMTLDTTASGSYFTTTYDIYAASYQSPGTYSGKVKYLMVHPHSDAAITNINDAFARIGKTKIYSPTLDNYYYTMQDMTSDICSLVAGNGDSTSTQLIDARDDNVYWVTKLKDGHCWMTQNLDFDLDNTKTLNSLDTDLNVIYNDDRYTEYASGYSQADNIIYWKPDRSTINFSGASVSGWSDSNTIPYSANKTDDTSAGHASIGNYYNWTAVIASNNSANASTQNYVAENSICPKGWRLPKASPYNEFLTLANAYNITTSTNAINLSNSPLYFARPGFTDYGRYTSNNVGYYWSSTVYNDTNAYRLDFGDKRLDWNYRLKYFGFSVRCLTR